MIAGNLHRDVSDVRLFELGTVFSGTTEKVEERRRWHLAQQAAAEQSALHPARAIDFPRREGRGRAGAGALSDAHGLLRSLSGRGRPHAGVAASLPLRARRCRWRPRWAGSANCIRAKPPRASSRKPVLVGELYLDRLYKLPLRKPPRARSPVSSRCAAIFLWSWTRALRWEKIDRRSSLAIPELVEWRVREVFRDARLGAGEYSLLLGATFQAPDRTLREEELQASRRAW
jgi:phenylalanyl-tRNA synthetase beta chain